MLACGDGEARTLFKESDIGDTDGDGAPEFLDGWGHPISFIRWAPALDRKSNSTRTSWMVTARRGAVWQASADRDHDPFDIYRRDLAAYRLIPLVVSAGRDESFGIRMAAASRWTGISNTTDTSFNTRNGLLPLLPYTKVTDPDDTSLDYYLGTPTDETAVDDIHNHLISTR